MGSKSRILSNALTGFGENYASRETLMVDADDAQQTDILFESGWLLVHTASRKPGHLLMSSQNLSEFTQTGVRICRPALPANFESPEKYKNDPAQACLSVKPGGKAAQSSHLRNAAHRQGGQEEPPAMSDCSTFP